jgi:small subunit ribosomal protein S21
MKYNFSIKVGKNEPVERALKRLQSKMTEEGLMDEVRRLRSFETPAQKKKRKLKNAHKRAKLARKR